MAAPEGHDGRHRLGAPLRAIGFVLPGPIECSIHHNSFPVKALPLFLPHWKLGLFGAVEPGGVWRPPAPIPRRPDQIGFVWCICPSSHQAPPGIGFVLPGPIECAIHHNSFPPKPLPLFLPRRELALFVQPPLAQGGGRRAEGELPGPAGNWVRLAHLPAVSRTWGLVPPGFARKLALFCRGLSNVLFTITPFPPSLCPSFCSAGNWVCLAHLSLVPRPCGPRPARRSRDWLCFASFTVTDPALPRPGQIGFVFAAARKGRSDARRG